MAFRRERNIRDVYEDRFPVERGAPYRRSGFGRPEEEYGGGRGFEYDGSQNFYRGGPPRSYHGDGPHFPAEHRGGPPPPPPAPRRVTAPQDESYPYYRGGREEAPPGRPMDFRPGGSGRGGPLPPPPSGRGQGSYPPPRSLPQLAPEASDDTVMQAILSLDRGEDHEGVRRKAPYPAIRDRSPPPLRRDVPPPSPHNRSRGYSPERAKHPYPAPPSKKKASVFLGGSRDGSPHSSASMSKDESLVTEPLGEEVLPSALPSAEEPTAFFEDFQERRAQAITAKAREIEKVYRQDCETFGMVVKMLVAKEPSLEKLLQNPLKENLGDIRERCLDDLRSFIGNLDEATA